MNLKEIRFDVFSRGVVNKSFFIRLTHIPTGTSVSGEGPKLNQENYK